MTAIWILLALGVAVIAVLTRKSWMRGGGRTATSEMGTLSHHWLAEQRLGQKHDVR